ncbi:NAD(P)/FAD-dependent oxidoreductase [Saccharopolyspora cebuensis]|uniref:NAD(P)/FAD-dependent oxidoreductase n=1 Tax=Saccharopolyspora cebuensis TaxID=418759 RepID=A0ABV4CC53_9PSEU
MGVTAVVLGGGLAGMLVASVLAERGPVVVVERDRYPAEAVERKGVPQAHHGHLLLPGGVRRLDALLPGLVDELLARGAQRLGLPEDVVSLSAQGWAPRFPAVQHALSCSRALLDHAVRTRVLADERISVRTGTDAEELRGDAARVGGVLVRDRETRRAAELPAELVVDATGRGSRTPRWLTALGVPPVPEERVDPGLAYATRLFRAPEDAPEHFPNVSVQASPGTGRPGRAGVLFPIEDRRWLITLSGTRGGEPPADADGFAAFARALPHPVLGELIARADPLGPVRGYRNTANHRRRYERTRLPSGFLVVGDAVGSTNPTYGQGMSVTAAQVVALRDALREHGGDTRRVQRAITAQGRTSWSAAAGQDVLYPEVLGRRPGRADVLRHRFGRRLERAGARDPEVFARLLRGHTLTGSPAAVLHPRVLRALLRDAPARSSAEPPFTEAERAVLGNLEEDRT